MLCFYYFPIKGVGEDKGKAYPSGNDVFTALLLALPPQTWSGIKDNSLLQEMKQLISMVSFPTLLQQEVKITLNSCLCVVKGLLRSHEAFVLYWCWLTGVASTTPTSAA